MIARCPGGPVTSSTCHGDANVPTDAAFDVYAALFALELLVYELTLARRPRAGGFVVFVIIVTDFAVAYCVQLYIFVLISNPDEENTTC